MANREAKTLGEGPIFRYASLFPVLSGERLYTGNMVSYRKDINLCVASADAANHLVLGVVTEEVDNSAASVNTNTISYISTGVHLMANAGDITDDNIDATCYVTNSYTVALSSNTASIKAGVISDVVADGVYVDFGRKAV